MRNRERRRPLPRARRRGESDDGSDSRGGDDGGRTNAGPPPEWDGTNLGFQDYAIKAKLWLATTRSKPRMRGPLLLQKLSKNSIRNNEVPGTRQLVDVECHQR